MKQPFEYIDVDAACAKFVKSSSKFGEAMCFICLEGDEGRERPLLRDCSCRGATLNVSLNMPNNSPKYYWIRKVTAQTSSKRFTVHAAIVNKNCKMICALE